MSPETVPHGHHAVKLAEQFLPATSLPTEHTRLREYDYGGQAKSTETK
jgi:hypothetical protein